MRNTVVRRILAVAVSLLAWSGPGGTEPIPECRLDDRFNDEVAQALDDAIGAFRDLGEPLGFDAALANPRGQGVGDDRLRLFVVLDAAEACTGRAGDPSKPDSHRVLGGCVVVSTTVPEIRCSSDALRVFAEGSDGRESLNPSLLYVLAHELAHLRQGRRGEFAGRTERITLDQSVADKIARLRRYCDPVLLTREEAADELAFAAMRRLLPEPPYRNALLSERGAMYWNIDRIALAAEQWQSLELEQSDPGADAALHPAFNPTEFPTPSQTTVENARVFVCDVLTGQRGEVLFPVRSRSHPFWPV